MAAEGQTPSGSSAAPKWARNAWRIALFVLLFAASFASAGRIDWIQGWLFFAVFVIYGIGWSCWLARTRQGLLEERGRAGKNVESWDKVVITPGFWSCSSWCRLWILDDTGGERCRLVHR